MSAKRKKMEYTSKSKRKDPSKKAAFDQKIREYRRFLHDDEDYDWHYIIRILRYKLERTRKHILDNHIIVKAPQVGREIKAVIDLLKRVERDRYFEELHKPFWKKYGHPKMISGKATDRGVPVTIKYPKETPANRSARIREQRRLMKREDQLRNKDLERAFKLILKNLQGWWD